MRSSEIQAQLGEAIQLAQSGQRSEARRLLERIVQQEPDRTVAWMWLATVATDRTERVTFLERALTLDPTNARVQDAYAQLTGRVYEPPPAPSAEKVSGAVQRISPSAVNLVVIVGLLLVMVVVALLLLGVFDSDDSATVLPTMPSRTPSNTPGPSPTATWTPLPTNTPGPSPTSIWNAPPATWTPLAVQPATRPPAPTRTPAPRPTAAPTASPEPGAETE